MMAAMPKTKMQAAADRTYWLYAFGTVALTACASPQFSDPDIARPSGKSPLKELPGPLLVFDSYQSALLTACQKIVTKPHATAGRKESQGFDARWRASTEYCAWIYYTPDEKYVLSKLTDQTDVDPTNQIKKCLLPSYVDDRRFPAESIKYIYALHNHLFDDVLSKDDLLAIVSEGFKHGFEVATKDGNVKLSSIAFFSNDAEKPTCDGFYQYIPMVGKILKWTHSATWKCEQTHRVEWDESLENPYLKPTKASCSEEAAP